MNFAVYLSLVLLAVKMTRAPETAVLEDWVPELDYISEKKLDEDWKDYMDSKGGEYDEKQATEPSPSLRRQNRWYWHPTSAQETPFVAVIFTEDEGPSEQYQRFFKGEEDPGMSHIEPMKACGAALLSPKFILTMCGCLTLVMTHEQRNLPRLHISKDTSTQYVITSHVRRSIYPEVFVSMYFLRFAPSKKYTLDLDSSSHYFVAKKSSCILLHKTGAETKDIKTRARRAYGDMVVMPFKPIAELPNGIFPVWPPLPFQSDFSYTKRAVIVSLGMRLTERTVGTVNTSIRLTSLVVKHCNIINEVCNQSYVFQHNVVGDRPCFCPVDTIRPPQLVGGVIGWPVVSQTGEFLGLTASEVRSTDGTVFVSTLTESVVKEIDDFVGRDVLVLQNRPLSWYRQIDLKEPIYDYLAIRFRTTPQPYSDATDLRANFYLFFTLLLSSP